MKVNKLKIVIFDGSLKTTTFINRLVLGLSKNHETFIIGFDNSLQRKLPNVHYVDLGSSQKIINLIIQSKIIAWKFLLKKGAVKSFFKTIKNILLLDKKQLQQDNFNHILKLIQPDILHVQWPSLLPWCEDVLLEQKIKVVLSQRGYQSNVRPFVDQKNKDYLQQWYPKIAGFHSVSKAITMEGNKLFFSTKKNNKVVYSGFDFNKLVFLKNYKKENPLRLLSVGRPHWVKGYSDTLRACKLLKEKGLNFNYTIVGTSERNEEILYLIHDFGLQEHVMLLPKMPQKKIYQFMHEASVLLFPSIIEGLPNVIVEAMALGIPVISTRCGGVVELIEENKTGWLVPSRNPKAIAHAIIEFSNTSISTLNNIRLSARKKVEGQHSEDNMVAGMEELYYSVMK